MESKKAMGAIKLFGLDMVLLALSVEELPLDIMGGGPGGGRKTVGSTPAVENLTSFSMSLS